MPDPGQDPSCEQLCIEAHKAATDAAWVVYQASAKGPADVAAYLTACSNALTSLNTCWENCQSGPHQP